MRFGFFILLFLPVFILAQTDCSSVEIRAGHILLPGDYFALRYQQATNYPIDYSVKLSMETSHSKGLHYSAYGLDLLMEYPFSIFRLGIGPTAKVENEPSIYAGITAFQRIHYGLAVEGMGEWMMTEVFGIGVFAQQKFLFNTALGKTDFVFGLGIIYHLNPLTP